MSPQSHTSDTLAAPEPPRRPVAELRMNRRRLRFWIVALTTLATAAGLAVSVWLLGSVSGEEFSPRTFRSRSFRFYELPVLQRQITPIRRKVLATDVPRYLRQQHLIDLNLSPGREDSRTDDAGPTGEDDVWHLVRLGRGMRGSTAADAQMLVRQLSVSGDGDDEPYWKTWSKEHPEKAKILWPIVQRLAMRELYVVLPGLLEIAQRDRPIDAWIGQIRSHLADAYRGLIQDARAAGRPRLADELFREARTDDPTFELSP